MSTPKPKRAPTGLSREAIALEALGFVDREGLGALSMRRLAHEVGAGTMTLYGYFRDKDDLLDAVVETAAAQYALEPPTGDWRQRLGEIARQMQRGLAAHPSLVQLRLQRPILTPGAMRGTEIAMEALIEAGLDRQEAASAFRALFLYAFAFTAFSAPELTPDLRHQAVAAAAALPQAEFPIVSSTTEELVETLGGDEEFERGLDLILTGIEGRVKMARGRA
jgi:AcrR family transcriptional regulator